MKTAHGVIPSSKADLTAFRDLKIVEMGVWLAGPSACSLLADLGAEVIKIEPPTGDPLRHYPSAMRGGADESPGFALLNRGKKSVVLDISQPEDAAALERILSKADVLVTNVRLASLKRAGFSPESLAERFPRLIFAVMTGQGLKGPDKDRAGFDTGAFWARSGFMNQLTADGAEPVVPIGGYGDIVASLSLFGAIVSALFARGKSGRGALVEASLLQTGGWILAGDIAAQAAFGRPPKPRPRNMSRTPLVNSYRTSDGRWFLLTLVDGMKHFPGVCQAVGEPSWTSDPRFSDARAMHENSRALIDLLDERFGQQPLSYWAERFEREGVLWQKVATPAEMMNDPQLVPNDMVGTVTYGDKSFSAVLSPFRLHGYARSTLSTAPRLGEHTDQLVKDEK